MGVVEIMLTQQYFRRRHLYSFQLSISSPPNFFTFFLYFLQLSLSFPLRLSVILIGEHSLILIQSIDFYSSFHSLGL